jgi:acetyl esterase/lipase
VTERADYDALLDGEIRAFVRRTEALCPSDSFTMGIDEYRRRYDAMCRDFQVKRPAGVSARDERLDGVSVRRYLAGGRGAVTVIYAHGGSFSLGGLDSHDDACAGICAGTGAEVVAVDYRLLPEHRLDDALGDAQAVFDAVTAGERRDVVLAGDSAGGYLCAALAHANRGNKRLRGQVLIYPGLGGDPARRGSRALHAHAPLLSYEEAVGGVALMGDGTMAGGYPIPLRDGDLGGLPPTVAIAAECDPLADDARDYAKAIVAAGGCALALTDKGLVHGHLRARHMSRRARASFERVLRAISLIGAGGPVTRAALDGVSSPGSDQIARDLA